MDEEIAVEQKATITFDIPAYQDKKTGKPFHREIIVTTKKAYAMYKKTLEKYTPPAEQQQ